MISRLHSHRRALAVLTVLIVLLEGCGKGCEGPALDTNALEGTRKQLFSTGPKAFLVIPNPIDATRQTQATSSNSDNALRGFQLPKLSAPTRLENDFIRVKVSDLADSGSKLASPNSAGEWKFAIRDTEYSEVMAYHATFSIKRFVEALGFSIVQSRPLVILVRAPGSDVNAIYDHNYFNPSSPRTIRLTGDGEFAPGMDRDMYWHEFGHLTMESISKERGIDYAGDSSAVYTQGSSLHEAGADYLNATAAGRPYIGRWLARNFEGYAAGAPIRNAVDTDGKTLMFNSVGIWDGTGAKPERYAVAEWLTRVLWQVREGFVKSDSASGSFKSDRLFFTAVSLLQRDTSMEQFRAAMVQADDELYCGGNSDRIKSAFDERGFPATLPNLPNSLKLQAQPVSLNVKGNTVKEASGGSGVGFKFVITNPNDQIARNVRIRLESNGLVMVSYLQGFGDLRGGDAIKVGTGGVAYDYSPTAEFDNVASGRKVPYVLRVTADNAPETVVKGELTAP